MLLLSLSNPETVQADSAVSQVSSPSYAKWGRIAMEETAKAYRGASIVDYKYEGRFRGASADEEERFLLWLQQDGREFGVRVTLTVDTGSDKLIAVKLRELQTR
ncbi:DUF3889 domain-containing protein [Paenibacillus sp. PL2-23]|uniref:DUF3889 domain-containing protein n=1 Tax=Paenibacillus sp. PL2-23 TaxID=2100729 RepID=UPI0030F4F523